MIAADPGRIVPHDFLMLGLLSEDRLRVRPIALSGEFPETEDIVLSGELRMAIEREAFVLSEMLPRPGSRTIAGWLRTEAGARVPFEIDNQPFFQQLVLRGLRSFLRVPIQLRGGIVGGTSAGASAVTTVMVAGGKRDPVEGRGLGLIDGVIVDQHFLKRNRTGRMLKLLSRHPDQIGLGIDEGTAVVVELKTGNLRVFGQSYVLACVPTSDGVLDRLEVLKAGELGDAIFDDVAAAREAGVESIPALFVNGRWLARWQCEGENLLPIVVEEAARLR